MGYTGPGRVVEGSEHWDEETDCYVWTEERNPFDGATYRREVYAAEWVEYERHDCFCCSCWIDDNGCMTLDGACRNHGFWAQRACEKHNLRGTGKCVADNMLAGEVYVVDLVKLRTVQEQNAWNRERGVIR